MPSFGGSYRCCDSWDMPCDHAVAEMEQRSLERRREDAEYRAHPEYRPRPYMPTPRPFIPRPIIPTPEEAFGGLLLPDEETPSND